jgi:hypothetical protein
VDAALRALISAEPPDRSHVVGVPVVLMYGEGLPLVSHPSVELSLEEPRSLEVSIAPWTYEVCKVCRVEFSETYMLNHVRNELKNGSIKDPKSGEKVVRPKDCSRQC